MEWYHGGLFHEQTLIIGIALQDSLSFSINYTFAVPILANTTNNNDLFHTNIVVLTILVALDSLYAYKLVYVRELLPPEVSI
jgi:hypothetical protein